MMTSVLFRLLGKRFFIKQMSFWPPFWGTGIWVDEVSADIRRIKVSMRPHFWNLNYRGSHFGGSLFTMADPFYMLMLQHNLGLNFSVWDVNTQIDFLFPSVGKVSCEFLLSENDLEEIKEKLKVNNPLYYKFKIELKCDRKIIARIEKTIYIKASRRACEHLSENHA